MDGAGDRCTISCMLLFSIQLALRGLDSCVLSRDMQFALKRAAQPKSRLQGAFLLRHSLQRSEGRQLQALCPFSCNSFFSKVCRR